MPKLSSAVTMASMKKGIIYLLLALLVMALFAATTYSTKSAAWLAPDEETCNGQMISVSKPLTDLGPNQYVSMYAGPTGFIGGLYPNGSNVRPPAHNADGLAMAAQITPLDANGNANPTAGKIVLISIGMSNTTQEFSQFMIQAAGDPDLNPQLVLVDGARGSLVSTKWANPNDEAWESAFQDLSEAGVTPKQVQVAWVKLAQFGSGEFPEKAQSLQADLENVSRNLKTKFPNIKIAYFSSRSRAYVYGEQLSPEPTAFETGFAVRWMIEKQINGNPNLNFDPSQGAVKAPFLSWGAYIWIDGLNKRSDGQLWAPQDLAVDCIHPSLSGEEKVADQLMYFFKTDATAKGWFLKNPNLPPPPPLPTATPGTNPTPTTAPGATPTTGPGATPTDVRPSPTSPLPPPGKYKVYVSMLIK
jgi:hypothetical protein